MKVLLHPYATVNPEVCGATSVVGWGNSARSYDLRLDVLDLSRGTRFWVRKIVKYWPFLGERSLTQ